MVSCQSINKSLLISMRYLSTIFYLKPIQIFWRMFMFFRRKTLPFIKMRKTPTAEVPKLYFFQTNKINNSYELFGDTIKFSEIIWNNNDKPKLWNYHIQYFDFIDNCDKPTGLILICDWINSNPPSNKSDAWEPYPISSRVINWIKFLSKYQIEPSQQLTGSLQLQKKWLFAQRELHLLANHFFKNIVALFYLSVFFNDKKLMRWSIKKLAWQLNKQFLNNGMHFEFSPTYHALIVQDLLDVYNLIKHLNSPNIKILKQDIVNIVGKSMPWLKHLSLGGKYLQIGDVNYQDCPTIEELEIYMNYLGLTTERRSVSSELFPTFKNRNISIMLTNAPFSPRYNAAHSHADKNGLLVWYNEKPLFIDTGNYDYENSSDRQYARSIAAHNCIKIDNLEQANLWSTFRVGNRGNVLTSDISKDKIVSGFKFKNYRHNRIIQKTTKGFIIIDNINYRGRHRYKMYWHCAPKQKLSIKNGNIIFDNGVKMECPEGEVSVTATYCYPVMYSKQVNKTIIIQGEFINCKKLFTKIFI